MEETHLRKYLHSKLKQKTSLYLTIASNIIPLNKIPIFDLDEDSPSYLLFEKSRQILKKWMIVPPPTFTLFILNNQQQIFNNNKSLFEQRVDYKNNIIIFPDDINIHEWFNKYTNLIL